MNNWNYNSELNYQSVTFKLRPNSSFECHAVVLNVVIILECESEICERIIFF